VLAATLSDVDTLKEALSDVEVDTLAEVLAACESAVDWLVEALIDEDSETLADVLVLACIFAPASPVPAGVGWSIAQKLAPKFQTWKPEVCWTAIMTLEP